MEAKQKKHRPYPNYQKLTVYLHNQKHLKDFRTTYSFKALNSLEESLGVIETMLGDSIEYRSNHPFYDGIKRAYYSGKLIIKDGYLIT